MGILHPQKTMSRKILQKRDKIGVSLNREILSEINT